MGAFAAIGLILGFFALKRQDGRLGLLGAMLFGIGVAGDGSTCASARLGSLRSS
jgi:hypothetical protein